jgi:hypothetical protein
MERTRVEMDLNGCFGSLKLPRRNLKFEVLINTERERERERERGACGGHCLNAPAAAPPP